jgi:hypothetical protein
MVIGSPVLQGGWSTIPEHVALQRWLKLSNRRSSKHTALAPSWHQRQLSRQWHCLAPELQLELLTILDSQEQRQLVRTLCNGVERKAHLQRQQQQ